MSHYLLCDAPMGPVACGKCRSCGLLAGGSHPDRMLVQPESPTSAIKVDQVREIADFVNKTAQQSGRKIILLEPAENMNLNAANALLKSLEEPAGRTHLLLVCYEPSRLLPTIRSRCAKLNLTLPPQDEATHWLKQVGVADAENLLKRAGGEPLKVERWFRGNFLEQQQQMVTDLRTLAEAGRSPLEIARNWLEFGPVEVIDSLLVWVQEAIRLHYQPAATPVTEGPVDLLEPVSLPWLFRYRDKLTLSKKELLSQNNPNLELLLDELLMGWSALCRQR